MQFNQKSLIVALALQTVLTGCASITKDAMQPVRVDTVSKTNETIFSLCMSLMNLPVSYRIMGQIGRASCRERVCT